MPGGRKPGTWKCRSCQKWAKPGMVACPYCGAEREVKNKGTEHLRGHISKQRQRNEKKNRGRGQGIAVKERSAARKKAERDSGVGSTDMKKMSKASDGERRRMRGRALQGTPLALDIDRAVWRRYEAKRAKGGEDGV